MLGTLNSFNLVGVQAFEMFVFSTTKTKTTPLRASLSSPHHHHTQLSPAKGSKMVPAGQLKVGAMVGSGVGFGLITAKLHPLLS
jgi:hypothetical protein